MHVTTGAPYFFYVCWHICCMSLIVVKCILLSLVVVVVVVVVVGSLLLLFLLFLLWFFIKRGKTIDNLVRFIPLFYQSFGGDSILLQGKRKKKFYYILFGEEHGFPNFYYICLSYRM